MGNSKICKDKIYYQCFSLDQHLYLQSLNFKSEFKARHFQTNRVFWFYFLDKEGNLDNALKKWSQNNPNK